MHTYIHAYMQTDIHTDRQTYVRNIHTYTHVVVFVFVVVVVAAVVAVAAVVVVTISK